MRRRLRRVVPFDPGTVVFTQVPYDGPIAVTQRLRNLVEIAIDIQTRKGFTENQLKSEISEEEKENVTHKRSFGNHQAATIRQDQARHQAGK